MTAILKESTKELGNLKMWRRHCYIGLLRLEIDTPADGESNTAR